MNPIFENIDELGRKKEKQKNLGFLTVKQPYTSMDRMGSLVV